MEKSRKSGMFNNPYYVPKDKHIEVKEINDD
jgi:hypothetical protein